MLKVEVAARGTGVWDLPHLDTDRCPVRFARGLFSAGDATLAGVVPDVAALVFVDEGVAAGRPESVDRAVAASRQDVRHVWVPTTLHGLVAALEAAVIGRAHVVLCDFELLRSLSDRDWCGGIAPAIEAALSRDRAFFWWLERQAEELWHRSLPAMAWVMYRTAQLRLPGPSARLGVPLVAGGAGGATRPP